MGALVLGTRGRIEGPVPPCPGQEPHGWACLLESDCISTQHKLNGKTSGPGPGPHFLTSWSRIGCRSSLIIMVTSLERDSGASSILAPGGTQAAPSQSQAVTGN